MANKKLEELSKTFTYGGGQSTAPVSNEQQIKEIPTLSQSEKQNPLARLAETFSYDTKVEIPKTQPKAVPKLSEPSFDYESVIKEYESLPKTNILQRTILPGYKEARETYARKQELNPLYEQAKDIQTKKRIADLGITNDDILMAQLGNSPLYDTRKLLQSKGMTDKAEIKELANAILNMSTREGIAEGTKNMEKFADEHPVLGTMLSYPVKVAADVTAPVTNAVDYISGNPLTNSKGGNAGVRMYQGMRENASKDLGNVGKFAYNVGNSIVDMAPVLALGGGAGLGFAGLSASQESIPDLIDRGLNPEQIISTSLANGAFEAMLEKLPLGNLEKWAQQPIEKSLKSIAKVIGSQMLSEGIEEGGTDIAGTIYDVLMNGDKAELRKDINEKGFLPAMGDYFKQVGYDALAGAVSGGIMGGGNAGINLLLSNAQNNNTNIPTLNQQTNNAQETIPTVQQNTPTEKPTSADLPALETRQTNTPTENNTQSVKTILSNLSDADIEKLKTFYEEYKDLYNLEMATDSSAGFNDFARNMAKEYPQLFTRGTAKPMFDSSDLERASQAIQETLRPITPPKEIKSNSSFGESIDGIKKSFSGKSNYIGDSKNEYALKFKSSLDAFKNSPTPKNYKNAIKALDKYEANSGSKMMKNWQGEWYEKKFDGSTIRKTLEQFGEQYGLNQEIPKLKKQNNVMAEDTGLNEKTTFKQIPSIDDDSNTIEVDVSELEDRRNGATYSADTATNTLRNSEVFNQNKKTRQMIEDMIKDGTADVDRQTWLAANTEAINNLDEKGFDGVKADIMKSGTETTQTQIAESVYVVDNEIQKALESGDTTEIQRFTRRLVERMHKVGQALQALKMYGNTAAGMVTATDTIIGDNIKAYMNDADKNKSGKKAKNLKQNTKLAEALKQLGYDGSMDVEKAPKTYEQILTEVKNTIGREMGSVENRFSDTDVEYLARLIEHGATTEELKSALNQHLVTGYFGMSAEDLQKINDLYKQADKAKSSKETAELRKQAAAIAAKYLGKPTFMDKWNSWRYLSMLGNPRTMIRNILGNTTFGAVTDVKDAVGAVLEKALLKEGQRTKAILNPVTDKALIDACAKDFDVNAYEEATEGGHKYNMKSDVEDSRQIFKSKLLEGARNLTNDVLEKSDIFALKQKYKKALAGYLKANGYNADVLKTDNAVLDKARAYAIEQAKEATFHADNKFADMLSDWSRSARERGGISGRIGEILIESTMPFKKTPANILQQGFEYSPLGMFKLISEVSSQEGANAYINTISKALTGSTILALGAWLTSRGLLVGQRGDDEDPFNKGADYALKIGDKTYTIDWTAPAALPLFVGSELYKAYNPNESAEEAKSFFEALVSVAEPAIDMSMLQGLSNTLDAIANAKSSKLGTTAANVASGYASQVVPTLLGQVARTIDPYRRSTRTNTSSYNNPITATLEKAEKKIANKIPGLSMTNEKYLDVWGEPQKNSGGNLLGRVFQNFISPGYLNDTSLSTREQKLAQLEKTYQGKGSLIPSLADNNKPSGGRMTNEEYSKWAKTRGEELKKAVDAALWHKGRIKESDLQDYIHDIELLANAIAKNKQFGTEIPKTYKKKYEAYKQGGYSAVMKYLIESSK